MSDRCECGADSGDINFDRSICACGAMHYFCNKCGTQADPCGDEEPVAATPRVSVITPTIPERAALLEECKASVEAQTLDGYEHVIMVDADAEGCSVTLNRCAASAKGEWLLPIADDDLLLPGAISKLLGATCDADIVYSPPLVTGNEDRWWFFQSPPCIPSTALIRASLWHELGGYDESLAHEEDRDLWTKALDAGARFVRVDAPTWVYRQHQGNKSFNKEAVAA